MVNKKFSSISEIQYKFHFIIVQSFTNSSLIWAK